MRRTMVVVSVALLLVATTGCRVAKAGTRCQTTEWGRDSTHVLQCKQGRWRRVMTIGQAANAIAQINAARAAQQAAATTTTTPPPATPALPLGPGAAFQVVYALTSDQTADTSIPAAIRHELVVVSAWFDSQTGGRHPRFVTSGGVVDVRTVTLDVTRAQVEASADATHVVQVALAAQGVPASNQRTMVYLDTGGDACGATAPSGTISVVFMAECTIYPSITAIWPSDGTYVAAHEMTHAFSAVDDCAPHATGDGHTNDDARDVLYSGSTPRDWANITLDPGHDDYYGTNRTDCYDIANSPLWAP
jgi:hypothetical protein